VAWIESNQELARHPKLARLAGRLEITRRDAVGLMHLLWWWCLDYAPEGDLSGFNPEEIAAAVDWTGDPGDLLAALQNVPGTGGGRPAPGFINDDLTVHDWHDYAGKLIERRRANAERKRIARAGGNVAKKKSDPPKQKENAECPADVPGTGAGRPEDGRGTSGATVPNQTITEPKPKPSRRADPVRDLFNLYAELYAPRAVFTDKRRKLITARIKEGYTLERLADATRGIAYNAWAMGRDPDAQGKKHNSFDLQFRDAEHVERNEALWIENKDADARRQAARAQADADQDPAAEVEQTEKDRAYKRDTFPGLFPRRHELPGLNREAGPEVKEHAAACNGDLYVLDLLGPYCNGALIGCRACAWTITLPNPRAPEPLTFQAVTAAGGLEAYLIKHAETLNAKQEA